MNPRRPQKVEAEDTGRKGYLEPDEPRDGIRRRIAYAEFWDSDTERLTYEHAVESNPIRPDEGHGSYIQRIASLVEGRYAKVHSMLPTRLGKAAFERRIAKLEGQREWSAEEWKPGD